MSVRENTMKESAVEPEMENENAEGGILNKVVRDLFGWRPESVRE